MNINELIKWAEISLSYWEKIALEKIVSGQQITESDYTEILQYLMEDGGLVEKTSTRGDITFVVSGSETDTTLENSKILLYSISELKNINSLVAGQELRFGPKMTVIFGANGSGKSSYSRVLSCAAFSRGNKDILPNVLQGTDNNAEKKAKLVIVKNEQFQEIDFKIGDICPELSSFYVFDSTSVQIHLTKADEVSFTPHILSYLAKLVDITDECRRRLQEQYRLLREPNRVAELFQGNTQISSMIPELNSKTNIKDVENISLSFVDEKRLNELNKQIAEFGIVGTDNYTEIITDLSALFEKIDDVASKINVNVAQHINNTVTKVLHHQSLLKKLDTERFKTNDIKDIDGNTWHEFVMAAKNLATIESRNRKGYPNQGDHCLLCQQPLDEKALSVISSLLGFLTEDKQAQLNESKKDLEQIRELICKMDLTLINQHVGYRYLEKNKPDLADKIDNFIKETTHLQQNCLRSLNNFVQIEIPVISENILESLRIFIVSIIDKQRDFEKKDVSQELEVLKAERTILENRRLLKQFLPQIAEYIKKLKMIENVIKFAKTSKHISNKQNELFKQLIIDRYIEIFEDNLKSMGRNLKVEIDTRASKGKTLRQLVLKIDKNVSNSKIYLDKILSEGEKRAVALADFLTEVKLDERSRGIIFDDPVTSLDSEWKEVIAKRLAEESLNRQVIIFTHDLHFLYLLKEYTPQSGSHIDSHWIKRGENDDQPGYIFCDNSPMKDKEYREPTKAESFLHRAEKTSAPVEQLELLQQGFGALRTTYEVFIIHEVFSDVVMRFEERISLDRLRGVIWDQAIVDEVIVRYGQLSRYIEGHSHSDSFSSRSLMPGQLRKEIDYYRNLRATLKALKNKK
jgi:energy-coupling factor transporter ATP-binding protein EcfA2